jgi:2-polyprenyl-3-methyl-5-hydroxy-6-metoxy-1,4-benzoquinol methylase
MSKGEYPMSKEESRPLITQDRDALVERLSQSFLGMLDIFTIYIGDRLGLYQALADAGSLTSAELASRTDTQERYVREWLEQQTVAGILEVEDATAEATARRFHVPPGHTEVLLDRDSLSYRAPPVQAFVGLVRPLAAVLEAFRNGGGVPYSDYGADLRDGEAAMNRPRYLQLLGTEWLPAIPDVHARLQADPPARVADIGCGVGWSCIGMAQTYPKIHVDGYDLDRPSIELARANVVEAGLTDRVAFHVHDASDPALTGRYELVTAFECVHDMADPVGALRTMRRLAGVDGVVLIMDSRGGDAFMAEGHEAEQIKYGVSVLHCLPVGMADQPSVGTGNVMRASTLRHYATEAGFRDVEILPIDKPGSGFYRLIA